ncbi:efflux transporter outer membrane subunit [Desulfopila sp. IMCC35006]|uniref:efflux transporter outer membrane subunit n=1 Tax=Desulfopila sp. IMCC35006 TaxID=2569542 RepID=UPI0010ACDEA5|nr:efflux transporter outer membrane subunit [Desulfopila sp. IMCC35006]TKB27175.1 efflux transporter outer membrane subunit [Desulfopila sp. IMCC35006]
MNQIKLCLTVLCLLQGLLGCAKVGPDYFRPDLKTPAAWQAPMAQSLTNGPVDRQILAQWWTLLKDPLLSSYIHQAIAGNLDLDQARSRLLQARASRDISSAGLLPAVDASGSVTRSGTSNSSGGNDLTYHSLGFDAGWELDLFGGRRRAVEAAQAKAEASEEDLRDVLVSLLAEVALNYIDIRTYQARLQIARDNLAAQQEIFALTEARYQSGLTSELALQQAKYLVSSTRAQIPDLQTGLANAANALAVLLGRPPGSLNEQLKENVPLPTLPLSVAVGIPADTLRSRPDIRKAERLLAAQTAQIGVATAELYPAFKLSGSVGLDALSIGKLFNSGSGSYSFGPSFSWPVFDGGAIQGNIQLQNFLQQEALAGYKAAVLSALKEVEGALVAYAQEQQRYQALHDSVEAAEQASALAEMQYEAGLINFTEVLDTRRSLLSFQDQATQSSAAMTGNLIRLYKALGGGWTSFVADTHTFSGK